MHAIWEAEGGRRMPNCSRLQRASRVARLAQILGTALGVLGVASLVYDGSQDYIALGLVLLGGAVESVAAVVSKNAPKKDWAPALFDGF